MAVTLAALLVNMCFMLVDYEGYIHFLERVLSPDGHIAHPNYAAFAVTAGLIWVLLASMVLSSATFVRRIRRIGPRGLGFWSIFFLLASAILTICWINWEMSSPLYAEDGLFESATAVLLALATLILIRLIFLGVESSLRIWLGVICLGLLVMTMEEISWGQRLFGWQTPQIWCGINHQSETNLHNLLGSYLKPFHFWATGLLGLVLVSGRNCVIRLFRTGINGKLRKLFPRPECILAGSCFLILSLVALVFRTDELIEGVLSVFGVVYAARLCNDPRIRRKAG